MVVVMPARFAPMNPPITGTCAVLQQGLNFFLQLGVGFFELRNRLHVGVVGDQHVARVDVHSVESAGGEGGGDDFAGEHFAEGGDMVGGAGSDFADGGNAAQEFVERFEVGAQFGVEFGEARGAEQFAGGVVVALLQRAAEFERGLALAFAGGARHGQQRVGDFGHGADHDDGLLRQAPLTMEATRSMALASSTEVPPNFMTIMGGLPCGNLTQWTLSPRARDSLRETPLRMTPTFRRRSLMTVFIPGSLWL